MCVETKTMACTATNGMFTLETISVPFALKFFSLIQNNIGTNFSGRLNFVTREHVFIIRVTFYTGS